MTEQERNAMQQALDALRLPCDRWNGVQAKIVSGAIAGLQEVLAVPAAPAVAIPDGWALVPVESLPEMLQSAREYLDGSGVVLEDWMHCMSYKGMLAGAPKPPAVAGAAPLTDEKIDELWRGIAGTLLPLAARKLGRAIEAAHGITLR